MTSKNQIASFGVLLGLAMLMPDTGALAKSKSQENFDTCSKAWTSKKNVKIGKHHFNCYAPKRVEFKSWEKKHDNVVDRAKFEGKLSHALRFRKDDQIYYDITIWKLKDEPDQSSGSSSGQKTKSSARPKIKPGLLKSKNTAYQITKISPKAIKPRHVCQIWIKTRTKRGGWGNVMGAVGRLFKKNNWEEDWNDSNDYNIREGSWQEISTWIIAGSGVTLAKRTFSGQCDEIKWGHKPYIS